MAKTYRAAEVSEPGHSPVVELKRCAWVSANDPLMLQYHDLEWGVPVHDDRKHFEFLLLEAAQAGLSWSIVLAKREGYRRAFSGFDPGKWRAIPTGEFKSSHWIQGSFETE